MIRNRFFLRPVVLWVLLFCGTLPLVMGCSDESVLEPDTSNDTFNRYVALGNSITAGFQSNGIVDSTQEESYAVVLAEQMNTRFEIPRLRPPGCPPPVENIVLSSLNESGGTPPCNFRSSPSPTVINNVAVPSAKVIDALNNLDEDSSPNELTTFLLGGRTQVEAATELRPTFASVWLGNNDALVPALQGLRSGSDADELTDAGTFETRIARVVDSLTAAGAERGILISVAKPQFTPNFSTGQAYAAAESKINDIGSDVSSNWGGFAAQSNCTGSGADTRIPFRYGFGTLFQRALSGTSVQLNCAPSTASDSVLTPSEQGTISSRIDQYNAAISDLASENDWAYLDINPVLQALYVENAMDADPDNDLVPKFPNAPDLEDPSNGPPTFGKYFSEDGIHPSSRTHRGVAFLVIQTLNERYEDVNLPQVSIPQELQSIIESAE